MRLYLARHAETAWNVEGRYQGRLESTLSERGKRQAELLAEAMTRLDDPVRRIVASPLVRTMETARAAAERLHLAVEPDARLIEVAHGTWEGRLRDEIAANDPERYRAWRQSPATVAFEGGESLRDVLARWNAFRADPPAATTLAVTHDAVVRCALVDLQGRGLEAFWEIPFENGAYAVIDVEDDRWRLVAPCVTAHLGALRADPSGQAL